jgi:predicted enzyme related to lactoylglutathione lyase
MSALARTLVGMTTTAPVTELIAFTIDTPDASALAAFYGALTGGEVTDYPEYGVASLSALGANLYFQTVTDYSRPEWPSQQHPQQFHLDLRTADLDAAVQAAVELGASVASEQPNPEMSTVMIDPHGHPFCLCPPKQD